MKLCYRFWLRVRADHSHHSHRPIAAGFQINSSSASQSSTFLIEGNFSALSMAPNLAGAIAIIPLVQGNDIGYRRFVAAQRSLSGYSGVICSVTGRIGIELLVSRILTLLTGIKFSRQICDEKRIEIWCGWLLCSRIQQHTEQNECGLGEPFAFRINDYPFFKLGVIKNLRPSSDYENSCGSDFIRSRLDKPHFFCKA